MEGINIMGRRRFQKTVILIGCFLFVHVCQLHAGYKMKWSSPDVQSRSYLFDGAGGMYADTRDKAAFDLDGDNIPEIIIYEASPDTNMNPTIFKISAYDSRNGTLKWQRIDRSRLWDKDFSTPPLLGFFDIDADGDKEAVLFTDDSITAVNWRTNTIKWSKPTYTSPIVFDMDNDGYMEIGISFYNPTTNKVHYEIWGSDKPINAAIPSLQKQKPSNNIFNVFQRQMYSGAEIQYQVQKAGMISLKIFNAEGSLVKELVNGHKAAGDYDVFWNGTSNSGDRVAAGNYFYQLIVDEFKSTKKALILK
jgi:hypothetical protein